MLGCQSTFLHRAGRPPFARYKVNGHPFCLTCLKLRIAEGPTLVASAATLSLEVRSVFCQRPHIERVASELLIDGTPVCWPCANDQLRLGPPATLSALKPVDPRTERRG